MTLARSYDEIMERIEVTPEMRRRVLARIAREEIAPSKAARLPAWKKLAPLAACLALLLAGAAVLPRLLYPPAPETPVQTVPDIAEAASVEELSELVGFAVTTDFTLPFEAEEETFCSYWHEMAQIDYSGEGYTATYRQSQGTDDNSGDYNAYDDTTVIAVDGMNVTLKGTAGAYSLATWTDGTYAYSLSLSPGISAEEWRAVL